MHTKGALNVNNKGNLPNSKDLWALTLVGPPRDKLEDDPLAVLHLDNWLYTNDYIVRLFEPPLSSQAFHLICYLVFKPGSVLVLLLMQPNIRSNVYYQIFILRILLR